jgi:hypothetical protein
VVTGALERAELPHVGALRRRFDRLVVVALDERPAADVADVAGVRLIVGADADAVCAAWNLHAGHRAARAGAKP